MFRLQGFFFLLLLLHIFAKWPCLPHFPQFLLNAGQLLLLCDIEQYVQLFIQLGFLSFCFDVSAILSSSFLVCWNFPLFLLRFWTLSIFSVSGVSVINSVCLLISSTLCPTCITLSRVKSCSRSICSLSGCCLVVHKLACLLWSC